MRKILAVFTLLILLAGAARAQISSRVAARFQEFTFAAKPASPAAGTRITITDCLTTACTAGGGTVRADLRWTGSAYELIAVVGGGGTPGGSDTYVQVNDAGVFFGEAGFTYNKTTNVLTFPTPFTLGATSVTSTGVQFNYLNALTGLAGAGPTLINATLTADAAFDILCRNSGDTDYVNCSPNYTLRADNDGTVALVTADRQNLVTSAHATANTVSIAQAGTAGFESGWFTSFCTKGAGASTITPTTSTVGGYAQITLATDDCVRIVSDGTNYAAFPSRILSEFGFMLGAEDGSALLTTNDQPSIFVNRTGRTLIITEVWIEADVVAAGTSFNLQRDDGTPANILTADLTANTTGQTACASGCTTTLTAEATVANGDRIDLLVVLASTAKRATIWVVYR